MAVCAAIRHIAATACLNLDFVSSQYAYNDVADAVKQPRNHHDAYAPTAKALTPHQPYSKTAETPTFAHYK